MNAEKSEVQNLTDPTQAAEGLDDSPPASDTGHVAQGEPKDYAVGQPEADQPNGDRTTDRDGDPNEERR